MSRDWHYYARSVSTAFDVPVSAILEGNRRRAPTRARHALFHILSRHHGLSRAQIGRILKFHDATVVRANRLTEWYLTHDPEFAAAYERARG